MKRFLTQFFAGFIGILGLVGIFIIVVDPFYHYHGAIAGTKEYMYSQMYQTPGAAKNLTYDSAIVGSSMTENFRSSWFDEMGLNLIKLSYSGGYTGDIAAIYDKVFNSGNDVKLIITDLNEFQLSSDSHSRYNDPPKYLYTGAAVDDVQYLWNWDVFGAASFRVEEALSGKYPDNDTAYTWTEPELFGTQKMQLNYESSINELALRQANGEIDSHELEEDYANGMANCAANIANLVPYIEEHPDTLFYYYFPPYSTVYWERISLEDRKYVLDEYKEAAKLLMPYENVKVFFFMDKYDWISDLEQYRDECHHSQLYNRYIFEAMNRDEDELLPDNIEEHFANMRLFIDGLDFDTFWDTCYEKAGTQKQ